jgi:hypothetical protein
MALPAIWRKFAAVPSPALPPVLLTVIARTLKNAFTWFVPAVTLSLHCCIEVGESEASDLLPGATKPPMGITPARSLPTRIPGAASG